MRIAIVGSSGSGKSTLARAVAERTGISHVEFDSIYHLRDWEPNPHFLDDLAAELDQPHWVCDGNYSRADHLSRAKADIIVVLDLPRRQVMRQVTFRTVRRFVSREELWNGNREPVTNFWRWDPEVNVIRWSWTHYHETRRRYVDAEANGQWDHAEVVWLRSHANAAVWVGTLPKPGEL